jgi:hypothetical protein
MHERNLLESCMLDVSYNRDQSYKPINPLKIAAFCKLVVAQATSPVNVYNPAAY